jgi:uncharacterized membrane-anchored protein
MKIASLRRGRHQPELPGVLGPARVDVRTRNLTKRLRPGDIAVIDHLDLDKLNAEALVNANVAAVVNASPSSSGRFPNLGTELVVAAGIPLLDAVGPEVMRTIEDGDRLRLDGDTLYRNENVVATGDLLTVAQVATTMQNARAGLGVQLEAFAGNTVEHLRRERELLLEGVGVPQVRTRIEGRHVVVVTAGHGFERELEGLKPYIRERSPVLIGVDGGADALLAAGHQPDLVFGDVASMSDAVLGCGAELVIQAYRDGRVPGLDRAEDLGVPFVLFRASGTSEDLALLLADAHDAELIVAVGMHASLVEFFDSGRSGMAGSFLTRLRVGSRLVHANAVIGLHRPKAATWPLVMLLVLTLVGLGVAIAVGGQTALDTIPIGDWWQTAVDRVQGLFS